MTSTQIPQPFHSRQLNSRADLLRWYAQYAEVGMDKAAVFAGYEPVPDMEVQSDENSAEWDEADVAVGAGIATQHETTTDTTVQRSGQRFYYLSKYVRSVGDEQDIETGLPAIFSGLEPLTESDLQPLADTAETPALLPLAPQNRLRFVLRYYLGQSCSHQLDITELVKRVSTLQPLQRLPRSTRRVPAGRVCVIVDKNRRTLPYWQDFDALCQQIVRQHGVTGLEIREIEDDPFTAYRNWFERTQVHLPTLPAPDSKVLILGDAGLIGRRDGLVQQRWLRFGRRLRAAGIEPVLLALVTRSQVEKAFPGLFSLLLWDRLSRFVPLQQSVVSTTDDEALERLLGLISVAVQVEAPLLRAIIQLLPADNVPGGLEAQVWRHEHVQAGLLAFSLRSEQREYYQQQFKHESPALQRQVLALLKQHHAQQHPAVWAEEVLQIAPLAGFDIDDQEWGGKLKWAQQFMLRFILDYYLKDSNSEGKARYARRQLSRFSPQGKSHYSEMHSTLYALGYRAKLRAGEVIPSYLDANIVRRVTQQPFPVERMTLVQCGDELWLQHIDVKPKLLFGLPLATLRLSSDQLLIGKAKADLALRRWSVEMPLVRLDEGERLWIDTGLDELELSAMEKPPWAQEIWRDQESLFVALMFAGKHYELGWQNVGEKGQGSWVFTDEKAPLGFDQYGLYGDLTVKSVTQRFRFIEPGAFIMGSPEDEADREPVESLQGSETQHEVTLTQGYWFADTTVTQAFWQAVTGDNPSHFKGNLLPVEKISWEDVQVFIEKINQLIPELNAGFPTEAQWEYACRAETVTPFSFGKTITKEQVNCGGSKTVQVKSLPPNQWGLYEMHGNVWEWCRDEWQQKIPATPVSDPLAEPEAGKQASARVVRGGSWVSVGRICRSAFRDRNTPVSRNGNLGVRLSLGLGATNGGAGSKLAASKTQRVAEQRRGLMEDGLRVLQDFAVVKNVKNRVFGWLGRKK